MASMTNNYTDNIRVAEVEANNTRKCNLNMRDFIRGKTLLVKLSG